VLHNCYILLSVLLFFFSTNISRINLELGKFMMPVKSDAGYVT